MKSLLVTRPKEDSLKIKEYLSKIGFNVYIEPMFSIKHLRAKIDVEDFDFIISTSQHSIIALSKITKNRNKLIITAGHNTMQIGEKLGFTSIKSFNNNVNGIISYLKHYNGNNVLYIRGKEITCNLKNMFINRIKNFQEVIVYNTIDRKYFSKNCYNLLLQDKISAILFYSSRTADIFIELIKKHNMEHKAASIIIYVISNKVAETAKKVCWKNIKISDNPTNQSLLSLIASSTLVKE